MSVTTRPTTILDRRRRRRSRNVIDGNAPSFKFRLSNKNLFETIQQHMLSMCSKCTPWVRGESIHAFVSSMRSDPTIADLIAAVIMPEERNPPNTLIVESDVNWCMSVVRPYHHLGQVSWCRML